MEVVLLGTGTLVPEADRAATGLVVEGRGRRVSIDLGRGVLGRMASEGFDPTGFGEYFFSHLHADHTADLVSLLFALRHGRAHPEPVRLHGPVGLAALVGRIEEAWPEVRPDYDLQVRETEGGVLVDAGLRVEAGPVHHGDHAALGYRVRDDASGRLMAFTGDSGPGPALDRLADGADLLVAECGDGMAPARGRHLHAEALADLADRARVGRVVVLHIDPRMDRGAILQALSIRLGDRLVEARDGLRLQV